MPTKTDDKTRSFVIYLAISLFALAILQWLGLPSIDHDELEAVRWGATHSWFHDTHPPLVGFVSYWWAELTEFSTLAFKFLSKFNAVVALLAIYILSKEFLKPAGAIISVAAYSSTYAFIPLAEQMDANSIVFSLWPAVALALWRALVTGRTVWWAVLGLACALSVLGKYHSLILIAVAFVLVLSRPTFRRTIASRGFWLALTLFAASLVPHVLAYMSYDYSMVGYVLQRGEDARGGIVGRLSVIPFVANHLLLNLVGLYILIWQVRPGLTGLRSYVQWNEQDDTARFLLFIGFIFPLFPTVISLASGITLLGSWGLSAWFLTPAAILYACVPDLRASGAANPSTITARLRLWPYQIMLPAYLCILALVVVADNFMDVARPTPIPAAMRGVDELWSEHTDKRLALVVTPSRPGQGMAFYSVYRPLILHRAAPEQAGWLLDENYCSKGPVAVLVEDTDAGRAYLESFVERFGAPDFSGDIRVEPMRVRMTITTDMEFELAGYERPVCFR